MFRSVPTLALAVGVLSFLGSAGQALAAPANDNYADAISFTSVTAGTNVDATLEVDEPAVDTDDSGTTDTTGTSVWWTWTAPASHRFLVSTCDSTFDTYLGVYTGGTMIDASLVGMTNGAVTCGDGTHAEYEFDAVEGTEYHFSVRGVGGASGDVALEVTDLEAPPANDAFASATVIDPSTRSDSFFANNTFATVELGEPANHGGQAASHSVWWTWTPDAGATMGLETCGSNFDTVLSVYSGATLGGLVPVAQNDDSDCASSMNSRLAFVAEAGVTYFFVVDGYFSGEFGDVELTMFEDIVNDAPYCDADLWEAGVRHHADGSTVSFDLDAHCVDPDGDVLTFSLPDDGANRHGAVAIDPATNVITWTPTTGFRGYTDYVSIDYTDGEFGSTEATRFAMYERGDLVVNIAGPAAGHAGQVLSYTATIENLASAPGAELVSSVMYHVTLPEHVEAVVVPANCAAKTYAYMGAMYTYYECTVAGGIAAGASHAATFSFTPGDASVKADQGVNVYVSSSVMEDVTSGYDGRYLPVIISSRPLCAAGQTGTYPNCVTPPPATCPTGTTGTPPNCLTPQQRLKKTMDQFLKSIADLKNTLTTVLGPLQFGGQVTAIQPKGGAVATNNGQVVTGVVACKKACTWTVAYSAVYTPKAGTARAKKRVARAVKLRLPAQKLSLKPGKPGALKTKLTKKQIAQIRKGKAPKIVAVVSYKVGKVVKKKTVTFKLKFAPRKR